jgi:hypothetical protein
LHKRKSEGLGDVGKSAEEKVLTHLMTDLSHMYVVAASLSPCGGSCRIIGALCSLLVSIPFHQHCWLLAHVRTFVPLRGATWAARRASGLNEPKIEASRYVRQAVSVVQTNI